MGSDSLCVILSVLTMAVYLHERVRNTLLSLYVAFVSRQTSVYFIKLYRLDHSSSHLFEANKLYFLDMLHAIVLWKSQCQELNIPASSLSVKYT